jgi:hypothetical protein
MTAGGNHARSDDGSAAPSTVDAVSIAAIGGHKINVME